MKFNFRIKETVCISARRREPQPQDCAFKEDGVSLPPGHLPPPTWPCGSHCGRLFKNLFFFPYCFFLLYIVINPFFFHAKKKILKRNKQTIKQSRATIHLEITAVIK